MKQLLSWGKFGKKYGKELRLTAYHWEDCGIFCRKNPDCNFWDYDEKKNECLMYKQCHLHKSSGKLMGQKDCPSKRDANPGR